ncbi:prepilin-type N-terminal cleavage/methylation domain-containing protein [Labrys wisconsinensis]|uniref:Type II secretory pathway pseudopilin PulG n=1 Tax=Labrys wisconsinensis TaxID=425677 RepID=A0ABU0JGW2_9HYPH|nr:prepilin-type N-terminal cleavage/methylation domain-containing protein [Labrys wisconsinensis]MDQ0473529.1 type II secretory pathway pseudopilin PulG [Labrys wisconsinensis]
MTGDSGLTLVEALVALVIASFVVMATGSLVAFLTTQSERQLRSERDLRAAASVGMLLDQVASGVGREVDAVRLQGGVLTISTSTPPLSLAAPGPVRLELAAKAAEQGQVLALRALRRGGAGAPAGGDNSQVLVTDADLLRFELAVDGRWSTAWTGGSPRPSALRLTWRQRGSPLHQHVASLERATSIRCLREPGLRACRQEAP